ncbi:ATP-binding protein [Methyloprofundus sp.]|uniref:ATP-binding protein n=1 Tax=Methyloprofundus sp. TaxID=2020875 RepID=UPI003D0AD8EE
MQYCRQIANSEFQAKAEQLILLRELIRDCLRQEGCEQDFIQRMVLAVNEAGMNIIQHAYNNRGIETFRVEVHTDGKELTFCLTDSAPTVDKSNIKSRDLDDIQPGGLGVHFINELMDRVDYLETPEEENGNILQMKKQIEYL